ncbi:MAG TPA: Ig-like domain-containing protein [Gemmatimonadaceae bacterium]|nr:Ig-like domain-containing protein [Gemmatimonadaceae bacterium]
MPLRVGEAQKAPWHLNAHKLVTAAASTGAALVSIFSFLYSFGVLGKSESHQSIGNIGAAWLGVKPAADTAHALGDTIHFAATVTDKNGSILVGAKPVWTTENPAVAKVLSDGSVIARGPGSTTITVVVGSLVQKSRIVVKQDVASVEVNAGPKDSLIVVPEGESRVLRARALDARGHAVAGYTPQWHIDDTSVVALDSASGALLGRNTGRTLVTAVISGISGHAPVSVIATAAAIAAVSGTAQRAAAGSMLPQAVIVRVTSLRGRPVPGAVVLFRAGESQGSVEPASTTTDADGRARTVWTLGDLPGRQTLFASVDHVDSTLAIVAEADPVAANTRVVVLGDPPSGPAGSALEDPVALRVTDSLGRVLPDVPVTWIALDGSTLDTADARTDSVGEAHAHWTLGARAGTQRLRAQIGSGHARGLKPVTIEAAALAGPPSGLVIVSGDDQKAVVDEKLRSAIVVRVVDAAGNGVAGAPIILSPSAGAVPDTSMNTDSSGIARIRWTMGRTAGTHTLAIHVDGVKQLHKLTARALPAAPANLSFDDAPGESRESRARIRRLIAVISDVYGNPVPDARVSFSTKSGSVTPTRAVSDARGRVLVTWKPGSAPGERTLSGRVRGSDVEGSFALQPVAREAKPTAKPASSHTSRHTPAKKRS